MQENHESTDLVIGLENGQDGLKLDIHNSREGMQHCILDSIISLV